MISEPPFSEQEKKRGKPVPFVIIAFYLTFIVGFFIFVAIAFQNPPQLVTDQAYEKGLNYNQTLKKSEEIKLLGYRLSADVKDKNLTVTFTDKTGAPVKDAHLTAWFIHPQMKSLDQKLPLAQNSNGTYRASVADLKQGRWTLTLVADHLGKEVQATQTLIIKE